MTYSNDFQLQGIFISFIQRLHQHDPALQFALSLSSLLAEQVKPCVQTDAIFIEFLHNDITGGKINSVEEFITGLRSEMKKRQSLLRKQADTEPMTIDSMTTDLLKAEKEVIVVAEQYGSIIEQAAQEHNPSVIANYVFNLAKTFNSFYSEISVANAETENKKQLRLKISLLTANILKSGMSVLGINVPERM